jgi:hypothetical protein
MNNIFYLNISKPNCFSQKMGLCNQLYAIKGTCKYAYKNNINVIVIENFLTDVNKNTYYNISDVIDLNHLNDLLKKYNIKVLDWNTDTGFEKIGIEFKPPPELNASVDCKISVYILSNLKFNPLFYKIADEILKKNKITVEPCNVVHLRLESDAIEHWGKENNLSPQEFKKKTEKKYIDNIIKYINKNYITIVVSGDYDNAVIKYLSDNNYLYLITEKRFEERELNAIVDLIITQRCDRTILGFHESSFMFTAMMRIIRNPKTQKIYFFCNIDNAIVKMIPN